MKLNTETVVIILSLILFTQVIVLSVQYKVNKTNKSIGSWLLGSVFMTLGFVFLPLVNVKSLELLARIGNPLLILGHIYFYIGTQNFFNNKVSKKILIGIFTIFNLSYYYHMFIINNIYLRTVTISATIALISFMIAYQLLCNKEKLLSISTKFTGSVFFIYAVVNSVRGFWAFMSSKLPFYTYQMSNITLIFIVTILMSNLGIFGFIIMLNQRLNIDNQLEKEKLQIIFNTNPDPQLITRLSDGLIIDVNEGFIALSGYSRDEVIGNSIRTINFWKNFENREIFIKHLIEKGIYKNKEFIFQRKDKSHFDGSISAKIIMIQSEFHIISVISDITLRKEFERALIESEEQYRSILTASPDDITITDLEGKILMISPAAKEMFGYESDFDDFIGMQLLSFIIPEDVERAKENIERMFKGGALKSNEYRGRRKDQSLFDIEVNSRLIYNAEGDPTKIVFIVRDISDRKFAEGEIQKLLKQLEIEKNTAELNSITDSLTGLFNRGHFDETLKREFFRLKRSGSIMSVIMLDIDYFKKFNDTYGHGAGDDCLRKISDKLKTTVERASDMVARYGGEEFIIILPETDENGAKHLGERLRKNIEDLLIPHSASDISKYVTVSLGIVTISPKKLESPEKVLHMVDEALYNAKEAGRNRSIFRTKIN